MSARVRVLCAVLAALAAAGAFASGSMHASVRVALGALALFAAASLWIAPLRAAWRALRRRVLLGWSVWILWLAPAFGAWIVSAQPVWGKPLAFGDLAALCAIATLALAPLGVTRDDADARSAPLRGNGARALLALTSFGVAFFAVELALRVFCVQPDGFAVTAMHRAWMELHWKPINSLRYRDREPVAEPERKRVLVVGDSFAAGHGIEELEDSFAFALERELGRGWRVNVAARPGWSSDAEYAALAKYPFKPDVVVLSYYVNDMSYLLGKEVQALGAPPRGLEWFATGLFSTSYLYWHVLGGGLDTAQARYAERQTSMYDDPELWSRHATDLARFVELARANSIELCVLVWPRLDDVASSRAVTAKVGALFREQGARVLDLAPLLADRPARELVLSRIDAHPSRALHAEVGRLLAPLVRAR